MKNIISELISTGKLTEDKAVVIDNNIVIFQSSNSKKIYSFNKTSKRAYEYEADGTHGKQITAAKYKAQCTALRARVKAAQLCESEVGSAPNSEAGKRAEAARAERERIAKWKLEHGEVEQNSTSLTKDEKPEAEVELGSSYVDDMFEGYDIGNVGATLGHHVVKLLMFVPRPHKKTTTRTNVKEEDPYFALQFKDVNTGAVIGKIGADEDHRNEDSVRLYPHMIQSLRWNLNKAYHGAGEGLKPSELLAFISKHEIDIWLTWSDTYGKALVNYYDVKASAARKAARAAVGANSIRGSYNRRTEDTALRKMDDVAPWEDR